MRPLPQYPNWQREWDDDTEDYQMTEPYPIAIEETWFFNSLGMSRGTQAKLAWLAGAIGLVIGFVSLISLISLVGAPSSGSLGTAAGVLVAAIFGFTLGAAAFHSLSESSSYTEIETSSPEVKVAASISIIAGILAASCVALVGVSVMVGFFIISAAARNK